MNRPYLVLPQIDVDACPMVFPLLSFAWGGDTPAPGLLAQGGDLSVERLKLAYSKGIFPWFSEGEPILWWSLDPRMVLYPHEFKLSHSLRKTLKNGLQSGTFEIKMNTAFQTVIERCAMISRKGQNGTWITPDIVEAYTRLHQEGLAYSVETWFGDKLVGGLYGVALGKMCYGESMFSMRKDASKLALCGLIAFARYHGISLIDCQQKTSHLKSLGAFTIPRDQFVTEMKQAQKKESPPWFSGEIPQEYWPTLGI